MLRQCPPFIATDPEVLGGMPCFVGTRVPIAAVVASLDAGMTREQLDAWVPGVTQAHIEAARAWLVEHPATQSHRRRQAPSGWVVRERKVVPPRP